MQYIENELKKKQEPQWVQVCKKCGSQEVARLQWVNPNNDVPFETSYDPGIGIEWCFGDCQGETHIIDQDKYNPKEVENDK